MNDVVNVGMVGLGFGAEFIPIYRSHPNAAVAAICRRNETELNKVGDVFEIEAEAFGRPLRNTLSKHAPEPVRVRAL